MISYTTCVLLGRVAIDATNAVWEKYLSFFVNLFGKYLGIKTADDHLIKVIIKNTQLFVCVFYVFIFNF